MRQSTAVIFSSFNHSSKLSVNVGLIVSNVKNMYGKQVRGIERSTFLVDPNGVLVREWRKVSVKSHCEEVLAALTELSGN
jgi:peroxiredoxin